MFMIFIIVLLNTVIVRVGDSGLLSMLNSLQSYMVPSPDLVVFDSSKYASYE